MSAEANREGFRILRRESALLPLELLWRWSFALGLLSLLFLAFNRVRAALILSDADQMALASGNAFAAASALGGALADSAALLVRALTPAVVFGALLWVVAATLARGLITRMIVRRLASDAGIRIASDQPRWMSFGALHCLRVAMLLILVIGYIGGALLAGYIGGPQRSLLTASLILVISFSGAIALWSLVNWVLSLAPIFVARDGLSALDATVAALSAVRANYSGLAAVAIWNGLVRSFVISLLLLFGIIVASSHGLPSGFAVAFVAFETLVYILISDIFLLARLGAYAALLVRLPMPKPASVQA